MDWFIDSSRKQKIKSDVIENGSCIEQQSLFAFREDSFFPEENTHFVFYKEEADNSEAIK